MRALVDRHHADLFYSLQLLFEDRLGIDVYSPIGHEWWDEGVWRFGEGYGDDRLARQFLGPQPAFDSHHPTRPIRFVTYGQARQMTWNYAVATVQDNQTGFARFAREVGARYVLQVGNTNQFVDWSLDPLALVSSEVPIRGRGITYHQELEAETTFRFRDLPADRAVIRSFVNCFASTACYRPFTEGRGLLADFATHVHGIDGDNIQRTSDIAELMAGSGWGWHDKEQGDGFGHVIHGWAAVGRPLIGHSSHYRGLMAEGFWDNLVTCIDLDRYTITEAMGLVREITSDRAQHEQMARAIRARFDEIDYPAEAETVRAFLG